MHQTKVFRFRSDVLRQLLRLFLLCMSAIRDIQIQKDNQPGAHVIGLSKKSSDANQQRIQACKNQQHGNDLMFHTRFDAQERFESSRVTRRFPRSRKHSHDGELSGRLYMPTGRFGSANAYRSAADLRN